MAITFASSYLRRHVAFPGEHGAWVFILSPLMIGLFAGGSWGITTLFLVLGALAAFLIRQPVTIVIKAYSGRRSKRDLPAARFWMLVYGLLGLLALVGLVYLGFAYVLILALPGVPVFIWHLNLISKRREHRQVGIEVVGSGVLALAAPAAYWVGIGESSPLGWWLFVLVWLQSAASIVYAYLRLEQRRLETIPHVSILLAMGKRALLYTSFNVMGSLFLGLFTQLPVFLPLPYTIQWVETIWGTLRPAVGVKPTQVGLRQLLVSSIFTVLFILVWVTH